MKAKMYILVREAVDLGHAILGVGHAALGGFLTWDGEACEPPHVRVRDWATQSFRKVVCRVSDEEFEKAKSYGIEGIDYKVMTESALDGGAVSLVWRPREPEDWPPFFKSLKLYR